MSDNHDNPFAPQQPERFEPYSEPVDGSRETVAHAYAQAPAETPPDPVLPIAPVFPSEAGGAVAMSDPRIDVDHSSMWLNRLGEELVAWLKTLASAAVYATLIVTFGFQVARVEGMSMAPTLQDQDRL